MLQHVVSVMVNQKDINISKGLWWSPAAVASSIQIHSGHQLIKSGGAVTPANTLMCLDLLDANDYQYAHNPSFQFT